MNRTFSIFRYEFLRTIRGTGFLILTLALPVLSLLAIGIYHLASGAHRTAVETTKIGYIAASGAYDRFTRQGAIELVPFDTPESATRALAARAIQEYFVVPAELSAAAAIPRFTLRRELMPTPEVSAAIKNFIVANLLSGKLSADAIGWIEAPLNVATTTLTESGAVAPEQGGFGIFVVPALLGLLLALALTFTSNYVLQSLSEEKESRLMEMLLSSVSTRQLLTGKVFGRGAAGLAQVIVWAICLPLLVELASSSIGGFLRTIRLPADLLALGVLYFVLGYLLFAVVDASIAAVSSSVREAQSLAPIFTLFAIAPFWFLSLLMMFPHNAVWVVFSIFPFSAPVLVMLRLGLTGVPAWQLAASVAALVACIAGGLLLAAKLLRMYVLMYGKRPTIGAIVRNLRGV